MRRDTVKHIALSFCLVFLIPLLSGCNDTDDVQKIFTGKTWKMTNITRGKKDEGKWYSFPGVTDKVYDSYNPTTGTRAFRIVFNGSTSDDVISGDFSNGPSSAISINGTWSANGRNNDFHANIEKSSSSSGDTLGKYIIEAIKKATRYEGDERNLYLYYEYEGETLFIAFTPER